MQLAVGDLQGVKEQVFDEGVSCPVDLDGDAIGHRGDDVRVGDHRDRVAPGVGGYAQSVLIGHFGNAPRLADPAAPGGVGLNDVHRAGTDEFAKALYAELVLAPGDGHADRPTQRGVRVDILRRKRLFVPEHPLLCEESTHPSGEFEVVAHRGVHHKVVGGSDGGPYGTHCGGVVLLAPRQPHLHSTEPVLDVTGRLLGQLIDVVPQQSTGIGRACCPLAAQEGPHWFALGLSPEVPERGVYAPERGHRDALATVPSRDPVHLLPQRLDLGRVLSSEQRIQLVAYDQVDQGRVRIGGANAHLAGIGMNEDQ